MHEILIELNKNDWFWINKVIYSKPMCDKELWAKQFWKHYFSIKLILLYCLTMDTKIIFYLSLLLCLHHLLELQPRTICKKVYWEGNIHFKSTQRNKKVVFMTLWRGFNVLRAVKISHNEWEWIEFFVVRIK